MAPTSSNPSKRETSCTRSWPQTKKSSLKKTFTREIHPHSNSSTHAKRWFRTMRSPRCWRAWATSRPSRTLRVVSRRRTNPPKLPRELTIKNTVKRGSTDCWTISSALHVCRIASLKVAGRPKLTITSMRLATNWIHKASSLEITTAQLSLTNQCQWMVTWAARCFHLISRIAARWLLLRITAWICKLISNSNHPRRHKEKASKFINRPKNAVPIRKRPPRDTEIWHLFLGRMALWKDSVIILRRGWALGSKPLRTWAISCHPTQPNSKKSRQLRHWSSRVRFSKIRNRLSKNSPWMTSNPLSRIWWLTMSSNSIKPTLIKTHHARSQILKKLRRPPRLIKSTDLQSFNRPREKHLLRRRMITSS